MANTEKVIVQVIVKGEKDLQKINKTSGSTSKNFLKMSAAIGGATIAFSAISKAVSFAIKRFKDFEFQMAKTRAIANATDAQFKDLKESALELGRTTFFTATQVAELQTNFSKLGFTVPQILAAQEATLQLATVAGVDLGRAAVVAGAAVKGFALDASETARVVDVMTMSFNSSAMDLEKFQTSMTKVAPIAAGMNLPIESVTAAMSTMADAGIEASIAGTSMRNILLKMKDPTSDLSKHLGFTVKDAASLQMAFDVLNQTAPKLRDSLVDVRQVSALGVMSEGADRIRELTDANENAAGIGAKTAEVIGDTLEGAILRLMSATEGLAIAITEALVGQSLKEGINSLAEFFNELTKNADQIAQNIKTVVNWTITLGKLYIQLKVGRALIRGLGFDVKTMSGGMTIAAARSLTLGKAFKGLGIAARAAGLTIKAAFISTGIGALVVLVGELIASFMLAGDEADNASESVRAFDRMQERLNKTQENTNRILNQRPQSLEELFTSNEDIEEAIKDNVDDLEETDAALKDIKKSFTKAYEYFKHEGRNIVKSGEGKRTTRKEEFYTPDEFFITATDHDLEAFPEALKLFKKEYDAREKLRKQRERIVDQINALEDKKLSNEKDRGTIILTEREKNQKKDLDLENERFKQKQITAKKDFIATKKSDEDSEKAFDEHNRKMEKLEEEHLQNVIKIKNKYKLDSTAQDEIKLLNKQVKIKKDELSVQEKEVDLDIAGNFEQNLKLQKEQEYLDIQTRRLNGEITGEEAQKLLREKNIELIQEGIDMLNADTDNYLETHELKMKLEKQLIDLKLKGLKDEQTERQKTIAGMQEVGKQLIDVAGEDEKYQKVREAGVKISAAAALANNAEALSLQFKGLSKDISEGFPMNLLAVASTLALLISMKKNFDTIRGTNQQFAKGGMVYGNSHANGGEKFAVGGRVVELEGGEAVINKNSTAMFRSQLSAMNVAGGGVKFADGGLLNSPSFTQQQFSALGQNSMMSAMNSTSKVVVVESDITDAQRSVSVIETDATI
tara:strand:+ start:3255 stop:6326 length:3072 start_codon:yes stop_codon:yes gene_type:complete